jgi:hypothetical protein
VGVIRVGSQLASDFVAAHTSECCSLVCALCARGNRLASIVLKVGPVIEPVRLSV